MGFLRLMLLRLSFQPSAHRKAGTQLLSRELSHLIALWDDWLSSYPAPAGLFLIRCRAPDSWGLPGLSSHVLLLSCKRVC